MPSAGPSRTQNRMERSSRTVAEKGREARPLGLRLGPRDLALWCQSRMAEGGIVPPHSVLAPGTALGLLPSRALSSAQAKGIVGPTRGLGHRTEQRGD